MIAYTHSIVNQIERLLDEYPESEMIAEIRRTRKLFERDALLVAAICIELGISIAIAHGRGFDTLIMDVIFIYAIITIILSAVTLVKARDYVTALTMYEPLRKFDSARENMQYEKSSSKRIFNFFRWLAW